MVSSEHDTSGELQEDPRELRLLLLESPKTRRHPIYDDQI